VSHELRTPLAKLIMESELALRRERTPSEYRAALESVVEDARQMQRVIETLLAVARSEIDPRTGTSDAATVAGEVIRTATGGRTRDVQVDLGRPAGAVRLGVDGDLAERVLAPVVANALQFAHGRAFVDVRDNGATIDFVVTDDGPGVPADQREAIFAPGFRGTATEAREAAPARSADGTATARDAAPAAPTAAATTPDAAIAANGLRHGTGLGLALSRRLARAAGGDVVCEGSNGRTAFVVSLPGA
jgi:signal transduction histidine kinase